MSVKELGDFDFGFSAVSEDELKAIERELEAKVAHQDLELKQVAASYEQKLNTLYKMVMPLLNNLAQDAEKDYIYWPGRQKKMQEFIKKVEALVNDS
jgi:flavin-dependent dehydrogenase